MKKGGKRIITCPPSAAYGPKGTQGIPPNSTLIFEVTVV
jgi:FKBP-type peptidyl-prolyl cis-trans isomerase